MPSRAPLDDVDSRLELLLTRRSTPVAGLGSPGPDQATLSAILTAAVRTPDHGKLHPWRFILIHGDAREALGTELATAFQGAVEPEATPFRLTQVRKTFSRVPLVIAVISSPSDGKIPRWEQILSCGAVCQNILHACHTLGFGAQWLTQWYAYDPSVAKVLGLSSSERFAGFIYVGTQLDKPPERARPDPWDLASYWSKVDARE